MHVNWNYDCAWGQALLASRGWSASETGAAYERAFELSRGLGGERVLPVMYGLYTFYFVRGEYERALALRSSV